MFPQDSGHYYERRFIVSKNYIINFITCIENFQERKLILEYSIVYDKINRTFSVWINFKDGEDYKLFHNTGVLFMPGIKVEN